MNTGKWNGRYVIAYKPQGVPVLVIIAAENKNMLRFVFISFIRGKCSIFTRPRKGAQSFLGNS